MGDHSHSTHSCVHRFALNHAHTHTNTHARAHTLRIQHGSCVFASRANKAMGKGIFYMHYLTSEGECDRLHQDFRVYTNNMMSYNRPGGDIILFFLRIIIFK